MNARVIGKILNTFSLVGALSIPFIFFLYSFFVGETATEVFLFLKYSTYAAILGIIYFFVYNYIAKEKVLEANLGLFAVNSIYFLILLDITGGVTSHFIIILSLLIIVGFFISRFYGFLTMGLVLAYFSFDIIYHQKISLFLEMGNVTNIFVPFGLLSILGFLAGEEYRQKVKENQKMSKMVENLSTDKSQEEAIFSSIADGVYAVDSERNLVLFNGAAEEMTGWDEKSALGIKCWTVMKLKNEQDISVCEKDCPMLQVWNTGENCVRDDLCFINKSKSNIQISGSYSPIKDINGKVTGGICVFRDVTKAKEMERLRAEFISTASHELRTPITTLEGYISLASDEKVSKIDDKAKEYLDKAHSAVINMSALVKNLLSVTKIDEGKIEINKEKFEINEVIEQTVEELSTLAKNKGITLEFKKSSGGETGKKTLLPQIRVEADKSMVKEVLVNLIENAIKFTVKGGVTVTLKSDKDFAIVSIEDTGMGIPKDGQKHIFEKFYRVDNSATREVGGTGLGLYITRSIVELFGGKIWVESVEKKGTKFSFTMPKTLD